MTPQVGQAFGRWTVVTVPPKGKVTCSCSCGVVRDVQRFDLVAGKSQSCGCVRRAVFTQSRRTHGEGSIETPEYRAWMAMRRRCEFVEGKDYRHYGGRGIQVCERWQTYENFLADMGRRPSPGHSVDRRDNDGNYGPGNCRWATRKEQANNRRQSGRPGDVYQVGSEARTLSEWSSALGVARNTLASRLLRGWSHERVFSAQPQARSKA